MKRNERLETASQVLRRPAGDDPEFATIDRIKERREEFVIRCHATWKYWHEEATQRIVAFEGWSMAEKERPIGQWSEEYADYMRAVWRRVNDAIVWSLLGCQRHRVKSLCLYRKRVSLLESNPASVRGYIGALNRAPRSLAIWNDATNCIDIGDVTYIQDGLMPVPQFIELKEGAVNTEIAEILKLEGEDREVRLAQFSSKYSKSGVDQLNRVVRQQETNDQAIELLVNERGIDPITKHDKEIVQVGGIESYDQELNALLTDALDHGQERIELLAECVWVYANPSPTSSRAQAAARCNELLRERVPRRARDTAAVGMPQWDRDRIFPMDQHFFHPMAMPLFLRAAIAPRIVAELAGGHLTYRVWLYFDIDRFAKVIADCGALFSWGSRKDTGRARALSPRLRPPIFGGRLALIEVDGVKSAVTDPNLVQMLWDGTTPRSVAKAAIMAASLHRTRGTSL